MVDRIYPVKKLESSIWRPSLNKMLPDRIETDMPANDLILFVGYAFFSSS